jgi:hypothetical protein
MKKSFTYLFILLNTASAGSAIAAQDQALIQQTRKSQLAYDALQAQAAPQQSANALMNLKLPLDHGPRAEVTPWVNRQRRLRAEEESKAALAVRDDAAQGQIGK